MKKLLLIVLILFACEKSPSDADAGYTEVCVEFDTKAPNTEEDDLFTCYTDFTASECLSQNTGSSTHLSSPSGPTWTWFVDINCDQFCEQTDIPCNIESKNE